MKKALITILALWTLSVSAWSQAAVPEIFLVQNSGWMQPYFVDAKAQFPEILQRLVQMSCASNKTHSVLAVFNQSQNPSLSPKTLYEGNCSNMPLRHLALSIEAAHLPGSASVFANSDYRQALYRAITQYAKGKSSIFWMVTNNKNSPDNSHALTSHDADFYNMLHDSPQVSRVIALPLDDGASSKYFTSHGLIVFGIAYGDPAAGELERLVSDGEIHKYFGVRAASLKPLNVSAVHFEPVKVIGAATDVRVQNGALLISLPAKSAAQRFTLQGRFINRFYPYTIVSAATQATLVLNGKNYPVPLSPKELQNLDPEGTSSVVQLSFTVPPTPTWSLSTIFGSGRDIPAVLKFSLSQQMLSISPQFRKVMDGILPNAPMPAIFRPDPNIHSSQTDIPILIRVEYPIWPMLVVLVILAILLAGLGFLFYKIGSQGSKSVRVRIDGKINTYRLARNKVQKLKNADGEVVAELVRGMLGYRLSGVRKGSKVEIVRK